MNVYTEEIAADPGGDRCHQRHGRGDAVPAAAQGANPCAPKSTSSNPCAPKAK
jgi:hypothetical protein